VKDAFETNTDLQFASPSLLAMVKYALSKWGFLGAFARFLLIKSETRRFVHSV